MPIDPPFPTGKSSHAPRSALRGRPGLTLQAQLAIPPDERGIQWLKTSLQHAIALEHATLPLYLAAIWSVEPGEPVRAIFEGIVADEMAHMGLACNMLTAIGGVPRINIDGFVPGYPGPLPGGVLPQLTLTLGKLTRERVRDQFIPVERRYHPPTLAAKGATYPSIGAFYEAIAAAFTALKPPLETSRQLASGIGSGVVVLHSLDDVLAAITRISEEGEGAHVGLEALDGAQPGELAHYYQFREILAGKRLIQNKHGKWAFSGADIPWPAAIRDMADVPPGGHGEVTLAFNCAYSAMLDDLHHAWATGSDSSLGAAIGAMFPLEQLAVALMQQPRPDGPGNYGPDFRYIPADARGGVARGRESA